MGTIARGCLHVAEGKGWFLALTHSALKCLDNILRTDGMGAPWVNDHHVF